MILLARVGTISVLYVELRLESQTGSSYRNIYPHTQRGGLHIVCNVTKNNGFAGIEEYVIRPACESCVGVVESPSKSMVAVSDLTAIGQGRNEGLTAEILVKLTCERLRANKSVVDTVILGPFLCLFEAHEACLIAVFKVPDDFGTLTEFDSVGQGNVAILNSNINTCNRCIIGGSEVEAIKSTCGIVGKLYRNRVGVYVYVRFAGHSYDRQSDSTNLIRGGIRNYSRCCSKCKCCGVCYGNGLGTYHLAIGENLNIYSSLLTVGNKLSALNSTERIVGKCPCCISGHFHCVSVSIDCLSTKSISGIGSKDIVISVYVYNVKNTCGCYV